MIKQLLITLAVALIVVIIARLKRARSRAQATSQAPVEASGSNRSTTMLAGYALAAVMILATAGISWMRYQEANEIVQVEVIDARSGEHTIYQVRRKELGERKFKTIDGRMVSLGASDRMVRIE